MAFAYAGAGANRLGPGAVVLAVAYLVALPLMGLVLRRTRAVEAPPGGSVPWWLLAAPVAATLVAWTGVLPPRAELALYLLVVVAIGEELFFRGMVQSLLDRAWGTPWRVLGAEVGWGWVAQAVLFGLAHALWTTAAGLCFGWLRARAGTIAAPALVHGFLDVIGLVVVPALVAL